MKFRPANSANASSASNAIDYLAPAPFPKPAYSIVISTAELKLLEHSWESRQSLLQFRSVHLSSSSAEIDACLADVQLDRCLAEIERIERKISDVG